MVTDLCNGNGEKTRELLNALSSDEWEIQDCVDPASSVLPSPPARRPPKPPFSPTRCDLRYEPAVITHVRTLLSCAYPSLPSSYDKQKVQKLQNFVRWCKDMREVRKLRRRATHRRNVIREILDTEETYVQALELVVKTFLEPLQWKYNLSRKAGSAPMLDDNELNALFSNIKAIYECHLNLLREFRQRIDGHTHDPYLLVGNIMLEFVRDHIPCPSSFFPSLRPLCLQWTDTRTGLVGVG